MDEEMITANNHKSPTRLLFLKIENHILNIPNSLIIYTHYKI